MHAEAQSAISWLRTFKIEISSTSNRLYRNGHQQIEVSLIVEPISGKTITDKQLDSLAIVSEEDDGTYKLLGGLKEQVQQSVKKSERA
ncbi:hypothetical protein, partial [Pseudomonas sp.]|uniref:hypothetical protein n=1 Tax=Pseudomonas sp. TaxID=306 RepID=UPI002FC90A29